MKQAGLFVTTAAAAGMAFQASAQEIINTLGFTHETEQALSAACPDPTPVDPIAMKDCITGIWPRAYDIAANLSSYIRNYMDQSLSTGAAQGELLTCQQAAQRMENTPFQIEHYKAYAQKGIDTATTCIESFDRAVREVGVNLEQESRNMVVDQINCFRSPAGCRRPSGL